MAAESMTILDEGREVPLAATIEGDAVRIAPDALAAGLGWRLEPQGLCRGDVCVPRRDGDGLLVDDKIDLASFAALMQRPLAYDADAGIAVLADAPATHAAAFDARVAPAWTLPDLDGTPVPSSAFAGRKKLLIAWASW